MTTHTFITDRGEYEVEAWCDGADVDLDTIWCRSDGVLRPSNRVSLYSDLAEYRDESIEATQAYVEARILDRWYSDQENGLANYL